MNTQLPPAPEPSCLKLSFGSHHPRLHPGKWGRFVYYVVELFCWSIWFRHNRSVYGSLPDGPTVLVANHGSYLDWLLLQVVSRRLFQRRIQFIAKERVARHPLFGAVVRATESLVVEEAKKARVLAQAAKILNSHDTEERPIIGIFPEGSRSKNGEPLPAISGAAWLARKCRVPLTPAALCGFWEAWPPHRLLPPLKRRHLSIHFLAPLDSATFPDDQAATDAAMNAIYEVVLREKAKATAI